MKIVFIVHYFPPLNSSGAKRVEALSKYLASFGHDVTVITPSKTSADGDFTEKPPFGVTTVELDRLGRARPSIPSKERFEPMYIGKPSLKRRLKDVVMALLGQVPDPRLLFAFAFAYPWLDTSATRKLEEADVLVASTPPWPSLLAGVICKRRFKKKLVLDYRDHFSECHEMPGGRFAKWLEKIIDKTLLGAADHAVCISDPMTDYYRSIAPRVSTVLNGYDPELLAAAKSAASFGSNPDNRIFVRYMGIVSPGRVPHNLLKALSSLSAQRPDLFNRLRLQFFGNAALIADTVARSYPEVTGAIEYFDSVPYIISLQKIAEADYLLFSETSSQATLSAQGILTTKLFEYIGSGRPILADISAETLAGKLLIQCSPAHLVSQDPNHFFDRLSDTKFYNRIDDVESPVRDSLSRAHQARQYESLLSQLIGQ